MNLFFRKVFLFLLILITPGLILISLYIYSDPFRVVKKYEVWDDSPVPLNRDYVSTELFLKNKDIYHYNSFVFGSSRSISFGANSWKNHLDKTARPFKFDASGEGLVGIYQKIKFLDGQHCKLDNVLILLCRDAFDFTKNNGRHLVIKHPATSGESWIKFHFTFLKAFFNFKFLLGYYSFIISGKESILTHGIVQENSVSLTNKTNQLKLDVLENSLKKDSKKYYLDRKELFYDRKGESYMVRNMIKEKQFKMLSEISEILQKNKTKYRIILTPLYDEIKFSPQDKRILTEIFGNNLYDFTGCNFITMNITNWYETDHYRPFVADSMMNIIYK